MEIDKKIRRTLILGALGIAGGIALGAQTKFAKTIIGLGSTFVIFGAAGVAVKKVVDNRKKLDKATEELGEEKLIEEEMKNSNSSVEFCGFKDDGTAIFGVENKIIYIQRVSEEKNFYSAKFLVWSPKIGNDSLGERFLLQGYGWAQDYNCTIPHQFLKCGDILKELFEKGLLKIVVKN